MRTDLELWIFVCIRLVLSPLSIFETTFSFTDIRYWPMVLVLVVDIHQTVGSQHAREISRNSRFQPTLYLTRRIFMRTKYRRATGDWWMKNLNGPNLSLLTPFFLGKSFHIHERLKCCCWFTDVYFSPLSLFAKLTDHPEWWEKSEWVMKWQ